MIKVDIGKVAPTYRGGYETNTSYNELDIVEFNGSSYIARKSVTGVTPGTDDISWGLIANKGIKGDKGDKGDPGDKDGTLLNEVIDARNGKSNLKTRLDDEHAEVTEQLAQTSDNVNSQSLNIKHPPVPMVGAKGDGKADDTVAIQNIFNTLVDYQKIIIPTGTFLIKNLVIPDKRELVVEFIGKLKAIAGGVTDYLVATEKYTKNIPEAGQPISIITPKIDGSGIITNGLVIQTWDTKIIEPEIAKCVNGLVLSGTTLNGTPLGTSTMVNNEIIMPNIHDNTGFGIWVRDPSRNKVSDYFIENGFVYNNRIGFELECVAGVLIKGTHTYSNSDLAIHISIISLGFRIHDVYIEEEKALKIGDGIENEYLSLMGSTINGEVNLYTSNKNSGIKGVGNTFRTENGRYIQKWGSSTVYSTNDSFQTVKPYETIDNSNNPNSAAPNVFYPKNCFSSALGLEKVINRAVKQNYIKTDKYSDSAPTEGTPAWGDIVWNTSPASGKPLGWICVSEQDNTWKGFGLIQE